MTTPDPTSFGASRGISNPANDPAADALGATHPSFSHPLTEADPRAVPGLTIGFSAQATKSTVVRLAFMEIPLVAFILAVITGVLNAFTLVYEGTFATVQAGNILFGGLSLMIGDWGAVIKYLLVILAFAVGALISAFVLSGQRSKKAVWMTWLLVVLGVVTALLAVAVIAGFTYYGVIVVAISLMAGVMSNAYRTDSNMLFGALAVTFLIQMTSSFLARHLTGRKGMNGVPNIRWAGVFFSVLMGFTIGSLGAAGLLVLFGARTVGSGADSGGGWVLMIAAALFWVLAGYSRRTEHEGELVEPAK